METGLKGKVVLVTGASEGMGRSCAERFAAEGAKIAMCSRSPERIAAAAAGIRSRGAAEIYAQPVDVTDHDGVQRFVREITEKFGGVDVCVANSGGPPAKDFLSIPMDEWRRAVELNFLSVAGLAKAVVPHMQKKRWGRFIAITSLSVKEPVPGLVLSNAVRPAVVGLLKSLAMDFGRDNITFNNVGAGFTLTERLDEFAANRALASGQSKDEIYRQLASGVPLGRLASPDEIADAVVWLASERAAYVTSQSILVDGGRYKGL